MTLPYFLENYYQKVKHNYCSRCLFLPLRAMNRLSLTITSIMKSICEALRWTYEKIFYNQKQRKFRKLNRYYNQNKSEIKRAFFHLGATNISIDVKDIDESALAKMNKDNTGGSTLFATGYDTIKVLDACMHHLDEMETEYIEGKKAFEIIQDIVRQGAKISHPETTVENAEDLMEILKRVHADLLPILSEQGNQFWDIIPTVVEKCFVEFKILFQQTLPSFY